MAWFKKERKPRSSQRERLEIPADAWEKCDGCGHIDIREKFEKALNVCPECGKHKRFSAEEYVQLLTDEGTWRELWSDLRSGDPLRFEHYEERLERARKKAGESDALYAGIGRLEDLPFHLGVMNFAFMGGSMGSVVGEKVARLARRSAERKLPLVLVCASGGARMQEGVLSLMQMAKTSAAIAGMYREAVPFITILTDPTTGGVTASLAMLGDINVGEPQALIGFAGPRVIEQTVRETLPDGFQRSEFLRDHGTVDLIVDRREMRDKLAALFALMMNQPAPAAAAVET
jgi:acetyl-CoA carboxylase carboxyl transferase subunit beta